MLFYEYFFAFSTLVDFIIFENYQIFAFYGVLSFVNINILLETIFEYANYWVFFFFYYFTFTASVIYVYCKCQVYAWVCGWVSVRLVIAHNDPLKLLSQRDIHNTHTMCMKGKLINAHVNFTHTTGYSPSLFCSLGTYMTLVFAQYFDNIFRRIFVTKY